MAGTDRPAMQLAAGWPKPDAPSTGDTLCPSLQPGYSLPYHRPRDLEGHRRRGVLGLSLAALVQARQRCGAARRGTLYIQRHAATAPDVLQSCPFHSLLCACL